MLTTRWARHQATAYHTERVPVALQIAQLETDLRRELERLRDSCGKTPHRVFTELCGRSEPRPIGTRTLGQALIAAERAGAPRERLMAVAVVLRAFVIGLVGSEPECPKAAWRAETREQAEADPPQAEAAFGNEAARERAIEETRDVIAAAERYLISLMAQRGTR